MTAYRRYLQAFFVLTGFAGGQALAADKPDKVSFYFAAHEDDWQLFMNPSAFEDVLKGAAKTVFVHVTAGDAGSAPATAAASGRITSRVRTAPRTRCASWPTPTTSRRSASTPTSC